MNDPNTWYPSAESGGLVVGRFKYVKVIDKPKSLEADEVIFRDQVVLEHKAIASGDTSITPVKPHNQNELRMRFSKAWAAFQGELVDIGGTPLDEMGFESETILFLKLNGISNVEQLAELDDGKCQSLGFGWRNNRKKAQTLLHSKSASAAKQGQLDSLPGSAKRGPGRPRREAAEATAA